MISDEEWEKGPDASKLAPGKILRKKCDCPDFCERRCIGASYGGSKFYWCRNCGQIYELKGLRPLPLAPTPAVAQKLRQCEKSQNKFAK